MTKIKEITLYTITLGTLLIIWQIRATMVDNATLFPFPANVWASLTTLLSQIETYRIILFTLFRLLISLATSLFIGIILGVIAGFSKTVYTLLRPVVTGLRSLPVASLIVVILILYGQQQAVYIIGFLMIFPIMFEASAHGVINVNTQLVHATRIEAVNKSKKLLYVYFPLALPYIKTGLFQSVGLGFKVLVMAEFIAQTQISIGRMLYLGRINIQYADVFAWTIIIILIVLLIESLLKRLQTSSDTEYT